MKRLDSITFLLILTISCKEKGTNNSTTDTQETAEPKVTNSVTKTDRNVKIPKSQLYIIPPEGFVVNNAIGKRNIKTIDRRPAAEKYCGQTLH